MQSMFAAAISMAWLAASSTEPIATLQAEEVIATLEGAADIDLCLLAVPASGDEAPARALELHMRERFGAAEDVRSTRLLKRREVLQGKSVTEMAALVLANGCTAAVIAQLDQAGERTVIDVFDQSGTSLRQFETKGIPQVLSEEFDRRGARGQFEERAITAHVVVMRWTGAGDKITPMMLNGKGHLIPEAEVGRMARSAESSEPFNKAEMLSNIGRTLVTAMVLLPLATPLMMVPAALGGAAVGAVVGLGGGPSAAAGTAIIGAGVGLVAGFGVGLIAPGVVGMALGVTAYLLGLASPDLTQAYRQVAYEHNSALADELGLKRSDLPVRYFPRTK